MLESGVVSFGDFLTVLSADKEQDLLRNLVTAGNITDFFGDYDQWEARIGFLRRDADFDGAGLEFDTNTGAGRTTCVSRPCHATANPRACTATPRVISPCGIVSPVVVISPLLLRPVTLSRRNRQGKKRARVVAKAITAAAARAAGCMYHGYWCFTCQLP